VVYPIVFYNNGILTRSQSNKTPILYLGWLHVSVPKRPSSGHLLISNLIKSEIYVLDLIELLINGWPEDGLFETETCGHPK
jgi:hypothetical protein